MFRQELCILYLKSSEIYPDNQASVIRESNTAQLNLSQLWSLSNTVFQVELFDIKYKKKRNKLKLTQPENEFELLS